MIQKADPIETYHDFLR